MTPRQMLVACLALALLGPPVPAEGWLPEFPEPDPCDWHDAACAAFELPKWLPLAERHAPAFEPEPEGTPYWRHNLFKRVGSDQVHLLTEWWPQEFNRVGFTMPVTAAAVVASQSDTHPDSPDREFSDWFVRNTASAKPFADNVSEITNKALLLVGGVWMIAKLTGAERAEKVSSLSSEALLNGALYVMVLKRVFRRTRPAAGGTGAFFHEEVPRPGGNNSFPSGHATGAFAVAAVVAHEYRDSSWVPWVSYGAASVVALSRVSLGRHFPTDVIIGAMLGASIGRMVCYRSDAHERTGEASVWSRIQPGISPDSDAFEIVCRFVW